MTIFQFEIDTYFIRTYNMNIFYTIFIKSFYYMTYIQYNINIIIILFFNNNSHLTNMYAMIMKRKCSCYNNQIKYFIA